MGGKACGLCGQGRHKRARAFPFVYPCQKCGTAICSRHARVIAGETVCVRCLRAEPAAVRSNALRVTW